MKKIVAVCENKESKKALEEAGNKLGYEIVAETQINEVINNEISMSDIKEATAVLFVINGSVEDIEKIERFIDCEYYEVEPQYVINDAISVINEIVMDLN
ncbi:MAG: PTS sugar transporter subunit IIBC [Romboutsia sp.]|uniref:PTS sugar transporter subunit IIBC n=1 Tax=Romboutsia sp. TaxID=1965302 RepID=UPI003F2D4CA4